MSESTAGLPERCPNCGGRLYAIPRNTYDPPCVCHGASAKPASLSMPSNLMPVIDQRKFLVLHVFAEEDWRQPILIATDYIITVKESVMFSPGKPRKRGSRISLDNGENYEVRESMAEIIALLEYIGCCFVR